MRPKTNSQSRTTRPNTNPRSRKRFPSFKIFLLLTLIAVIGGAIWLRNEIYTPYQHDAAKKTVTIEPGASTASIVARLYEDGVLKYELPTLIWLRLFPSAKRFKAGDYEFKSPISPHEVIDQLIRGSLNTRQFTIPEGFNRFDIARMLYGLGLKEPPPPRLEDLQALFKNTSLIADLDPQATTLEGYLFPDTYDYTANMKRAQLVEAMVKRFREVYTPEMQARAEQMKMTPRQAVTMASLIEKEARMDGERELISSVFHRRLKMKMNLGCDPTVIYAAILAGNYRGKIYKSDLDRDSPYNTYKRVGLPPGPIASPGKRSLQAALNPAETDYLYFVVDANKNDGSHKFSATSAAHDDAVKALRQSEREQKAARQSNGGQGTLR
ncbi:MAG TPA: endolytic transglycosylase MltG [Blastocatellia bacterium]|nr:endolytic transglycosylase MltG [Blastocatellia bacterium]